MDGRQVAVQDLAVGDTVRVTNRHGQRSGLLTVKYIHSYQVECHGAVRDEPQGLAAGWYPIWDIPVDRADQYQIERA